MDSRMSIMSQIKEGIKLAEDANWNELILRVQEEPSLAQHKDDYGMLPLHWACTEDDVPVDVLKTLLKVYPEGALTRNNAQMLPLHIAIRAKAPPESLEILCKAHPSIIIIKTPHGKRPLELALDVSLNDEAIEILKKAEAEYEAPSQIDPVEEHEILRKTDPRMSTSSNRLSQRPSKRKDSIGSRSSQASTASEPDSCGVCGKHAHSAKLFKRNQSCHACGITLCKEHVAGKVELPNYFTKKTVCQKCMDIYSNVDHSGKFRASYVENQSSKIKEEKQPNMRSTLPSSAFSNTMKDKIREQSENNKYLIHQNSSLSMGYDSDTASLTDDSERIHSTSSETTTALLTRIKLLEESKAALEKQLADQSKVQSEAMLLLTQTMTRVAKLELKLSEKYGDETEPEDELEVTMFPSPFTEKFDQS